MHVVLKLAIIISNILSLHRMNFTPLLIALNEVHNNVRLQPDEPRVCYLNTINTSSDPPEAQTPSTIAPQSRKMPIVLAPNCILENLPPGSGSECSLLTNRNGSQKIQYQKLFIAGVRKHMRSFVIALSG